MKQETLEEAAEREYEVRKYNSNFPFEPQSFKLGAKWQQERMYSEEDLEDAFKSGFTNCYNNNNLTFGEWFEQFKK